MLPVRFLLFVRIEGFYIQALRLDSASPVLVHRDKKVLDANATALDRGASLGMGLGEAKAMFGRDCAYIAWSEEAYREPKNRWLDVCTEFADAIEPLDQHEALIDLSDHPKPEEIRKGLAQTLKTRTGFEITTGLGPCRWIAQVAAEDHAGLALTDPARFVAFQPVDALPISEDYINRLILLGCRFIGDVAAMSTDSLRRAFGKDSLVLRKLARGKGETKVEAIYPPDSISGRFTFEGAATNTETFDHSLKHLARKIGAELAHREVWAEHLQVWMEAEEGELLALTRKFSKPISSPASLLVALRLLCGTPEKDIAKIRLILAPLTRTVRVQKNFQGLTSKDAERAELESGVKKVKAVFGDGAIVLASEIKKSRAQRVRMAWSDANGWKWH